MPSIRPQVGGVVVIDIETTGLDLFHGARPFFVTACLEDNTQRWWCWPVNPLTRRVDVVSSDLGEIQATIDSATDLVGQNIKFDYTALRLLFQDYDRNLRWPWNKVQDTLAAGHILASNQPHDLTSMVMHYLGHDMEPQEEALEAAVKECRRLVQQTRLRLNHYHDGKYDDGVVEIDEPLAKWRIAGEGLPETPSATKETWGNDYWLPAAMAEYQGAPTDHPWRTVLTEYANTDSAVTLPLWKVLRERMQERGLTEMYRAKVQVLSTVCRMEENGVTLSGARTLELEEKFGRESTNSGVACKQIAAGYDYALELPAGGGINNSLRKFVFKPDPSEDDGLDYRGLDLPWVVRSEKTGAPSLCKEALDYYETHLPPLSRQMQFVRSLRSKRRRDTALSYLASYRKFWKPIADDWFRLYPSLNPFGSDTLRLSSERPNEQNISKQEGLNLRYAFGPVPGREWWAFDYENIELKIPAYESGERDMIELFEHPNDPPYYGSNHLLVSHILHPKLFEECRNNGEVDGRIFKERYKASWYQHVKNGNFAVQYGCQEAKADATYRVSGAYRKIKQRFAKLATLNDKYIQMANRLGYVETLPDKTVNPKRGYPLLCTRTEYGKVLPTVPLNYHVQGTACWCAGVKAVIRCQEQLDEWERKDGFDGRLILQVHDELVFDFPLGGRANLRRVERLRNCMEQSGDDIAIPLTVGSAYHPNNWAKVEELNAD